MDSPLGQLNAPLGIQALNTLELKIVKVLLGKSLPQTEK